jgi:lipopolysaccharide export system protein LptC
MIGGNEPRAIGPSGRYARRGNLAGPLSGWYERLPGNPYSRRVALLKVALPTIGISMLLIVVVWPRVAPLFDRFRLAAIDLREARELRMINPRYIGTDRDGHQFVVTAAVGRQVPQRDDVMSLDLPIANMQSHSGAKIVISSDSGVYQTQTQFMDAFGKVTVAHENGSTFVTSSARVDVVNDAAEGHAPVEGHGPQGDVTAQGFRVIDKGDIVIFTGQANLHLNGTKQQSEPPAPAAVPAPVAQAAAQIEAKVEPKAPSSAPGKAAKPALAPAAKAPAPAAKAPEHPKPAAKKPG